MKHLKTIFACLLMAFLSIGQVWAGETIVYTLTSTTGSNNAYAESEDIDCEDADNDLTITWNVMANATLNPWGIGGKKITSVVRPIYSKDALSDDVTKVVVTYGSTFNLSTATAVLKVYSTAASAASGGSTNLISTVNGDNGGDPSSNAIAANAVHTFNKPNGDDWSDAYYRFEFTCTYTSNSNKKFEFAKAEFYAEQSGSSEPTVLAKQNTTTYNVSNPLSFTCDAANGQSLTLECSNMTATGSSAALYEDAECNTAVTSGAWITNISGTASAVTFDVAANSGEARDVYMKIMATDGTNNPYTVVKISQGAYVAPTGTFIPYSGDLTEGDYVITYSGKALVNSLTGTTGRMGFAAISLTDGKIVNPETTIIWHIAPISETSYWTISNAAANKYLAGTGVANKIQLLAEGADNKEKWTVSGSSTYDFTNVANTTASVNAILRYNNSNAATNSTWACYGSGTGGALTLYKLDDGKPSAPTFSPTGGSFLEAQSVTLSTTTDGAEIYYTTDGTTTPTSGSTHYTGAIPVSSTTTIKAVAIKDDKSSSVVTATYTITTPQSVDDVWSSITASGPEDAYVWGYVSQTNVSGYANNFYISVNGSAEGNQLYAYRMNMNSFSVAVGDKVVLNGDLTIYGEDKEFKYTSADKCGKIISLEPKGALQSIAISGSATKTEYAANETFEYGGLKVMGTYANGFVGEITEGITWNDDLTDHKVTESTTVHVTATVDEKTSPAVNVAVTVAAKTLVSIAATPASKTIYTGEALPEPTIMATFSEGEPENVSTFAVYDTENAFDTETLGEQTITVSYTFGGATETTTYTVTVVDYANDVDHPYTPEQALYITINAVGSTKATKDIYVQGKVSQLGGSVTGGSNPGRWGYYISADGTTANQFQIYNGYYLNGAQFTNATKLHLNDEVIVKGKVIYYNGETPEFAAGESQLESLARTPNFTISNVAELEVGAADLAVEDLTITVEGEGAITLSIAPEDAAKATIVNNAIHAVGAGTVTVTASLAADGIYKAASTTFDVTVIAATTKYTVAFDENGADGGTAPTAIANQAEGASVTLPTNTWTKTNKIFDGWKVFNNSTTEEISYTGNSFTMPASAVTIQAQWADLSEWATTYTSNITVGTDVVKFSDELEAPTFAAKKTGTGSNYGLTTVIVPVSTSKLHFHAVCYGADTYAVTLKVKNGESVLGTFNINKDAGAKGSSEFTLANTPYEQYYFVNLTGITEPTTITFEAESGDDKGKRFIIFGVNQEGGLVPVLDRIVVTGDAESKAYDAGDRFDKYNYAGLGANAIYKLGGVDQTPVAIDFADIEWSSDPEIVQASTAKVTVTATYEGKSATKDITDLSITVTEPEITTDKATLEFGTYDQTANVADKEFYVTLKNVANASLEITGTGASAFAIDNTALTQSGTITVSASTATAGSFNAKVRITDNAGVAEAVEVSLHITVNAAEAQANKNLEWVEATEVFDGMQVVFTGVKSSTTYAMSSQASNNRTTAAFEDATTPGDGSVVFTLVAQGNGTYAIKTSLGEYLYAASNSANHLKTRDAIGDDGKAVWTITIGEENVASIAANYETANWRNVMQFNQNGGNAPVFACYATASQSAIKLYTPKYYSRTNLTVGRMGTVCVDHNVPAGNIQGADVYQLLYWKYGTSYVDCQMVDFEQVIEMEAGKPYLIIPTAENVRLVYGETSVANPVNYRGFTGTFAVIAASETNELVGMYGIVNNMIQKLGTYCSSKANRAYIDLSQTPSKEEYEALHPSSPAPSRRISLSHQAEEVTTDLDALQVNTEKVEKVMIEGQLFILRGGHVYDATGRLVK